MTASILGFVVAFLASVVLTYSVRYVAVLMGWLDRPDNFRKLHPRPVPRLGGVGIYFAFLLPIFLLYALRPEHVFMVRLQDSAPEVAGLLIGSVIALGMGVADDLRNLRPLTKLLFQVMAATAAYAGGLSIHDVSNPFGSPLPLGVWSLPVTVFWFVACMNAVNLMDGLDGLAAGVCLFVSATLFLVSLHFLNVIGMVLMACLSGAILGFLLFNFYPAKIFLGDSGSMILGYFIAGLSLIGTKRKAETAIALLIPIVAMGLPILDTSLSIVRRWYKRLPISTPDRQHVHHMLLTMGYSHRRAVLLLYALTVVFGAAAVLIALGRNEVTVLTLGTLFLITTVSIRVFGGLKLSDLFVRLYSSRQERRTAGMLRWIVDRAVQQMALAETAGGLWEACSEVFREMGMDHAELVFSPDVNVPWDKLAWQAGAKTASCVSSDGSDAWQMALTVRADNRPMAVLKVCQNVDQSPILPETPVLLLVLRDALAAHLSRLQQARGPQPEAHERAGAQTVADTRDGAVRDAASPAASS
jgi:UDP-GlcNAc:undecaprenyl-phosphate GlcNAc-1-phosphate transferase